MEDLERLGLVILEVSGPTSLRVKITEKGEKELEALSHPDRVVEESA